VPKKILYCQESNLATEVSDLHVDCERSDSSIKKEGTNRSINLNHLLSLKKARQATTYLYSPTEQKSRPAGGQRN